MLNIYTDIVPKAASCVIEFLCKFKYVTWYKLFIVLKIEVQRSRLLSFGIINTEGKQLACGKNTVLGCTCMHI